MRFLAVILVIVFPFLASAQEGTLLDPDTPVEEQLPEGWLDLKSGESGVVFLVGKVGKPPAENTDNPFVYALQKAGLEDVSVRQIRVPPGKYEIELAEASEPITVDADAGKITFVEVFAERPGDPTAKIVFYNTLPETTAFMTAAIKKSGNVEYLKPERVDPVGNVIHVSTEPPWPVPKEPKPNPSPNPEEDKPPVMK